MSTSDTTLVARLAQALANTSAIVRLHEGNQHNDINALLADAEKLIDEAKAQGPVNYTDYLDGLPLVQALWWFIENVDDETAFRTDYLFRLRQRVREATPERTLSDGERTFRINAIVEDWLDTIRSEPEAVTSLISDHYAAYSDADLQRSYDDMRGADHDEGLRDE